jgi:hypothetical protein
MSTLYPLPEPGTVEAFVVDLLEGAAAFAAAWDPPYAFALPPQRRSELETQRKAGVTFLRWLQLCALADLVLHARRT